MRIAHAGVLCHAALQTADGYPHSTTVQYASIDGIDPELLSLDIHFFDGELASRPVIIYVHGGGWAVGDKSNKQEDKLRLFSSMGYIYVSVNYRLSSVSNDGAAVRFPDHSNDVADAIAWVIQNIANYGGDSESIALMGHSAGAQLVALAATSPDFLPPRGIPLNSIAAVICLDTEGYDVAVMAGSGNRLYLNAFGSDPADWDAASPLYQLSSRSAAGQPSSGTSPGFAAEYPAFFVVTRGRQSRKATATAFVQALEDAGSQALLIDASGYSHEEVNSAVGNSQDSVITPALIQFLQELM